MDGDNESPTNRDLCHMAMNTFYVGYILPSTTVIIMLLPSKLCLCLMNCPFNRVAVLVCMLNQLL